MRKKKTVLGQDCDVLLQLFPLPPLLSQHFPPSPATPRPPPPSHLQGSLQRMKQACLGCTWGRGDG